MSDAEELDVTSPRGLDAFLQNLPKTAMENMIAVSNIPRLHADTLPRPQAVAQAETTLRKCSSQPDIRGRRQLLSDGGGSSRSESPALLATMDTCSISSSGKVGTASTTEKSLARSASSGDLQSRTSASSAQPKRHFFMPLLHVLPEREALSAAVMFNRARHVVTATDIGDTADSMVPSVAGSKAGSTHSNDVDDDDYDELDGIADDVDDEHIVALDEDVVQRSLNGASRRSSSLNHSSRFNSAFDSLLESAKAAQDEETLDQSQLHAEIVVASPALADRNSAVAVLLLPSFSFDSSRVWLREISRLNKLCEVIESFPCSRRGLLYRIEHGRNEFTRRNTLKWQPYMCELRGPFLFFFAASTQIRAPNSTDDSPLPLAYLRLSPNTVTDISYDYLKRHKKHVLNIWRNGIPGLVLPGNEVMNPRPDIMDSLQATSETNMVAWALAVREAVRHTADGEATHLSAERILVKGDDSNRSRSKSHAVAAKVRGLSPIVGRIRALSLSRSAKIPLS